MNYRGFDLVWNGDRSVSFVDDEFAVAVDPVSRSPQDSEAAIVLVTGSEGFDPEGLSDSCGQGTCVVLPEEMDDRNVPSQDTELVSAGDVIDIYGVLIEVVDSGETVSYMFNMKESSFLVSPDPTAIEDVLSLENRANVAFLSASSDTDLDKVVRNAVKLKPDVVVPYRYDGDRSLEGFQAELEDRNIKFSYVDEE